MNRAARGLLIGLGSIAQGHLHGYGQVGDLEIVAVVDACSARRAVAEQGYGLRAYPDVASALDEVEVDFLDICTPPDSHAGYLTVAIDRGLAVVCEKPVLVPGSPGFDEMRGRLGDARIYPCENYRFAPVFAEVQRLVAAGAVGELTAACIAIRRRGHALGTPEWQPDWRRVRRISFGGILQDHGPHAIYLLTAIAGFQPVGVSCVTSTLAAPTTRARNGDRAADHTEDTALVRLYCESSAEAHLWLTWASDQRQSRYDFVGTAGSISVNDDTLTVTSRDGCRAQVIDSGFNDPRHSAWFAAMFRDFAAKLSADADAWGIDQLRDAIVSSQVIEAAYRSAAAEGRTEQLSRWDPADRAVCFSSTR